MITTAILGSYQSDFARVLQREDHDLVHLAAELVTGALADAGIEPAQLDAIHVANAFSELYTGQGHLAALPATAVPELAGLPAMRHEAACASGSIAILAAMAELEAGRYDCILVLGLEQEKTMPALAAANVQAAAAKLPEEASGDSPIWPGVFEQIAAAYERRWGLDEAHLHAIGRINLENARANPRAQTRAWQLTEAHFAADDVANPPVTGRLRRNDCCQLSDGGVAMILVSERWLARHPRQARASITGWGHRTVGLPLAAKLEREPGDYLMPHVREAIEQAWQRAGIGGVEALDGLEVHDCMTPNEYLAIDHFGITPPGQSWQAVEEGVITRDGRLPINPGGGLIGIGHPVGATGIRMVADCARQVSGQAGAMQIDGARRMATLNIGGSTASTVSFIVEAAA